MFILINPINLFLIIAVPVLLFSIWGTKKYLHRLGKNILLIIIIALFIITYINTYMPTDIHHSYRSRMVEIETIFLELYKHKDKWEPDNINDYLIKNDLMPYNYFIYIDENNLIIPQNSLQVEYSLPDEYHSFYDSKNCFTFFGVTNLDSDEKLDIWAIDNKGNLMHLSNDLYE